MWPAVTCIFLLLLVPVAAGAGETSGRMRLQMGHEYDTNAQRICTSALEGDTSPQPPPDGVTRLIFEGSLEYTARKHSLMLSFLGGVKLFSNQNNEDQMAVKLVGIYAFNYSGNWSLGARMTFRDTTLRYHDRDYTLLRPELFSQNRLMDWMILEAYAGVRYYNFKPDAYAIYSLKYTHYGPMGGLRLRMSSGQITSSIFYQLEARFVDDLWRDGSFNQNEEGEKRFDLRHTGGVRVRHPIRYWDRRKLILGMSYLVSVNDTNSFGSRALWHRLQLLISMQLPADITLHLMGTLQFTDYLDGLAGEGSLYEPDADENENSLVVRVSYPLWKGLSLVLHGAVYRNAFHSGNTDKIPFGRETIMLGLAYDYSF